MRPVSPAASRRRIAWVLLVLAWAGAGLAAAVASPPDRTACPLTDPDSRLGLVLTGCRLLASDSAATANPRPFWGKIDCEVSRRHRHVERGGDRHETALGESQGDRSYRRLTVLDGDDLYGERCELGFNNRFDGPTAFYDEGERVATFASLRLPDKFPFETHGWQTVTQMKQAQPADNAGGQPILELQAHYGAWRVVSNEGAVEHWFAARTDVWTRFVWDVRYSHDPAEGWFAISADLNGDGDIDDQGERSRRYRAATLKTEAGEGADDGLLEGAPITSHLRAGIYHHPEIVCPPPGGCSIDVDNVQVLAP